MFGETELKRVRKGEIIQLQRKGFFRCDVPYAPVSSFSSREEPLILFHIPDGHTANTKSTFSSITSTSIKKNSQENICTMVSNIINNNSNKFQQQLVSKENKLSENIIQQERKIEELQLKINQEIQLFSDLKKEYKNKTGIDWSEVNIQNTIQNIPKDSALKLSSEIQKQGDKIRLLKSKKTEKNIIDEEVKKLLTLKSDYKIATGQDWKSSTLKTNVIHKNENSVDKISKNIQEQGDKVRQLKSMKAEKSIIDEEVKKLLALKTEYKLATNQDWKPSTIPITNNVIHKENSADKILENIQKQGDKIRQLKEIKTDKSIIDQEVKILIDLKNNYKTLTGQEWKAINYDISPKKKKKEDASKYEKRKNISNKEINKNEDIKDVDIGKTRLGLEAKKEENFFEWYSQIITKSGMIEYYDVSGCYILRPWSFAIWKAIKEYIDKEITQMGVQECYFPIFVTKTVLEKEKAHITDFAPEVAWVTKCGESNLSEPIAIRPTSETVMYPAYAKWLKSDTELPLKLNQWNNVVVSKYK